jgi:hypothetical protein
MGQTHITKQSRIDHCTSVPPISELSRVRLSSKAATKTTTWDLETQPHKTKNTYPRPLLKQTFYLQWKENWPTSTEHKNCSDSTGQSYIHTPKASKNNKNRMETTTIPPSHGVSSGVENNRCLTAAHESCSKQCCVLKDNNLLFGWNKISLTLQEYQNMSNDNQDN